MQCGLALCLVAPLSCGEATYVGYGFSPTLGEG